MWTCCCIGQRIWWQRTWRKSKYPRSSSPLSLLVRLAFSKPRSLWLVEKSAARKTCHRLRRITSMHTHPSKRLDGMYPPMSVETANQCHCGDTLNYLWNVTASRRGSWGSEQIKCHTYLHEEQDGGTGEWLVSLILIPRKVIEQIILPTVPKHMKNK